MYVYEPCYLQCVLGHVGDNQFPSTIKERLGDHLQDFQTLSEKNVFLNKRHKPEEGIIYVDDFVHEPLPKKTS